MSESQTKAGNQRKFENLKKIENLKILKFEFIFSNFQISSGSQLLSDFQTFFNSHSLGDGPRQVLY